MKTQIANPITNIETVSAADRSRKPAPFLQLAEARGRRPVRITLPPRRRESCLTRRAILAALREAEYDEWIASGGDYLDSMHQPIA